VPTLRLLLLLLIAIPLLALGSTVALIGLALLLIAALATATDWFLAKDGRNIALERVLDTDKLSLAAWNPVRLTVTNAAQRTQRIQIRDVVPPDFDLDVQVPLFSLAVQQDARAEIVYHVRPRQRGDARFGSLYLRVDGPLSLIRRTFQVPESERPIRVYPSLRDLRRYDLLVRRGLEAQPGSRTIRRPGASAEFERVREYLPDDEFRRMNWKATARRGHPMVNQFETERSQNLVMLLDAGRAMAALAEALPDVDDEADLPPGLSKLDYALNTALLLAYVGSLRGDRVALLAYADDVRTFVPPQRGRRALLSTVQALYNLRAEAVEPDHGRALDFLARRNLRRSLVVHFTDLIDRESSATLAAHLLRAARHHLVVCVTLGDPNVRRPAERTPIDAPSLYEKFVAQQLLDDRAALIRTLNAHGVLTVDTDATHLSPQVITTYLDLKHRGRI
jgi:uncharacterized protein (DUF58 family)